MLHSNPPRARRRGRSSVARAQTVSAAELLHDADIVAAMRRGEPAAWAAFDSRFRPLLEAFARKSNIPRWEWPVCITELLTDEALRLARGDTDLPRRLDAYLIRAVRNKYLRTKRATSCRDRNYLAASEHWSGERFVATASSEHARRASIGEDAFAAEPSTALKRLACDLRAGLTDDECAMLDWVGEGVPRRTIATWLGMDHERCAKRIWRLCQRLRAEATKRSRVYEARDRREIDRFLRRARLNAAPRRTPTEPSPPPSFSPRRTPFKVSKRRHPTNPPRDRCRSAPTSSSP